MKHIAKGQAMIKKFMEHPSSVNESYFQHMGVALFFFGRFCFGAFAALVHAFFPFLFVKTGSQLVTELNEKMVASRNQQTTTHPENLTNG